jgi:predicted DCC family thiol-disulfide oxidoreductase YuxK
VVLYDGRCGLCRWTLGVLLRWDRRRALRPVALQSPEAEQLLAAMAVAERMASLHVALPDGQVASGGAALTALARELPGGAPLARLGAALPALSDRGYRLVAGHRDVLGRLVTAGARRRADSLIATRER